MLLVCYFKKKITFVQILVIVLCFVSDFLPKHLYTSFKFATVWMLHSQVLVDLGFCPCISVISLANFNKKLLALCPVSIMGHISDNPWLESFKSINVSIVTLNHISDNPWLESFKLINVSIVTLKYC